MHSQVRNLFLITGSSGFIGYHLTDKLLQQSFKVIGVDNMNDYYDVNLKKYRLEKLRSHEDFTFIEADISDKEKVQEIFDTYKPNVVINLAAQAGVRYYLENTDVYMQCNVTCFYKILYVFRLYTDVHLIY